MMNKEERTKPAPATAGEWTEGRVFAYFESEDFKGLANAINAALAAEREKRKVLIPHYEQQVETIHQLRSALVDCCSEKDALRRTIDRARDKLNTVIFDSNSILSDVNRILLGSEQLPREQLAAAVELLLEYQMHCGEDRRIEELLAKIGRAYVKYCDQVQLLNCELEEAREQIKEAVDKAVEPLVQMLERCRGFIDMESSDDEFTNEIAALVAKHREGKHGE